MEESKRCVFNLIPSFQPYFVWVYCWVVSDFVSELLPHPRQNFRLPSAAAASLSPGSLTALAQVASVGWLLHSRHSPCPLSSPVCSEAITPSARHSSLSLSVATLWGQIPRNVTRHSASCPLLAASVGEFVTWDFYRCNIACHKMKNTFRVQQCIWTQRQIWPVLQISHCANDDWDQGPCPDSGEPVADVWSQPWPWRLRLRQLLSLRGNDRRLWPFWRVRKYWMMAWEEK